MNFTQHKSRNFLIGHVAISMFCRNTVLLETVGNWLAKFEVDSPIRGNVVIRFNMIGYESNERVPFILPSEAKLLYKNTNTKYFEYRGLWIILLQSATVIINRPSNKIIALAHYNDLKKAEFLEDFMQPLLGLMRQNGVFAHHAAAVSYDGRGFLLLGERGRGKEALTTDLLSKSFDFLADDRCFLRQTKKNIEVLGLCRSLDKGNNRINIIPTIKSRIIDTSQLVGLVFPYDSPQESTSRIEPMTQGEALTTLLPLTFVGYDRISSELNFKFSAQLVALLPSAKLIMGQDHECWHGLVMRYLSSIPLNGTKS